MSTNTENETNDDYPPSTTPEDPQPILERIHGCGCEITTKQVKFISGELAGYTIYCEKRVIQKTKKKTAAFFDRNWKLVEEKTDGSADRNYQNDRAYLIDEDHLYLDPPNTFCGDVIKAKVLIFKNNIWIETSEECNIKVVSWKRICNNQAENPWDEIAAIQHLGRYEEQLGGHQQVSNIIMPLDFLYDDLNFYMITQSACHDVLLTDLVDMRKDNLKITTEKESKEVLRGILDGVEWLHRAGITHRDIRPENIMIREAKPIIINMGMCLQIPFDSNGRRCLLSRRRRCGNEVYMTPEVFVQQPFDGHAVDMWGIGVTLFFMLTGHEPWKRPSRLDNSFWNITTGDLNIELGNKPISSEAKKLLQRMLLLDPRERLSLQQVRDHDWLKKDD